MATSLGDLLDALVDAARNKLDENENALIRADAGTALGHVGRALAQLHADGISRAVADIRQRQVVELARTCRELAGCAPVAEARLTWLAAAAADTVGVLRAQTTIESRWAAATAFVDVVGPLCDLIEPGTAAGVMADRLAAARRYTLGAEQSAALAPPARVDAAVLDRPIPSRMATARVTDSGTLIRESAGALRFATSTNTATLSLAEVLAVTFAAESLSEAAHSPQETERGRYARPEVTTVDAWRAVRTTLAPFTDGSRHLHTDMPPVVLAARSLHDALQRMEDPSARQPGTVLESIVEATQQLPGIADDLHCRAIRWAETGGLLAFACDLPRRDDTIAQRLAGRRPEGVIHADAVDLHHVTDALCNARLLSTDLAGGGRRPDTTTFPGREWAAHRAVLEHPHTPTAISEAKQEAYRQLRAGREQPAARRGR